MLSHEKCGRAEFFVGLNSTLSYVSRFGAMMG